jgi:hypothetical protein
LQEIVHTQETGLIERRPPNRRAFRGPVNGGTDATWTVAGANRRLSAV